MAPSDGGAGGSDALVRDASVSDAPMSDAGPCEETVLAKISVNGNATGSPLARVLVGDTVTLSAEGSCSTAPGAMTYEWQISPIDGTRETADPTLLSQTLTVYPVSAEQYTVSLTVRDSQGRTSTVQVFGFEAHGWQQIGGIPSNQIYGLDVGPTDLFIAGLGGAFRVPLDSPTGGFINMDNESVGDALVTNLGQVHWDEGSKLVWFSSRTARNDMWKITRELPYTASLVAYNTPLGGSATARDISGLTVGVEIATNRGTAETTDTINFTKTFDGDLHAVARGAGQRWAAGRKLYDIDNGGAELDPFATGDNKIRRMLVDTVNDELWLATDNNGVAHVVNSTGALIQVYASSGSNLPDNRVRDIAIETTGAFAGDIWVATANGIARYKRDRGVWVSMGVSHGLSGRTDVHAIAIDENAGRRRIYAGTTGGLVYSRAE